jgi:hypothetical protein
MADNYLAFLKNDSRTQKPIMLAMRQDVGGAEVRFVVCPQSVIFEIIGHPDIDGAERTQVVLDYESARILAQTILNATQG